MRCEHEFYGSCRVLQGHGVNLGHVPGFTSAHSQGKTVDELNKNLQEVVVMLLKDGKTVKSS